MVKIWFKDNLAWTKQDGKVLPMHEPYMIYANTRLVHNYIPPVITEDTWNGKTFPVQIDNWNGYQVQLAQREIAINMLSKLQSCKSISIEDIETGEVIQLDTLSSSAISIEPLGRHGTANQAFILNVKSDRVSSYPAMAYDNTNVLKVTLDSLPYYYYSDKEIISYAVDAEKNQYSYDDGLLYTAKTTAKEGKRMVFYLFETDAISLKNKVEFAETGDIIINESTDNFTSIESGKCTITELTEGLFKCEVEIITTGIVKFIEQPAIIAGEVPNEEQIFVQFDDDTFVTY